MLPEMFDQGDETQLLQLERRGRSIANSFASKDRSYLHAKLRCVQLKSQYVMQLLNVPACET